MNPYQVLGVSTTTSAAEIRSRYKKLASEFHPDRNSDPGAADRFKEIVQAYQILKDPRARSHWHLHNSSHPGGQAQDITRAPAAPRPYNFQERRRQDEFAEIFAEFMAVQAGRHAEEAGPGRVLQNFVILVLLALYALLYRSDPNTAAGTGWLFWGATSMGLGIIWAVDLGENAFHGILSHPALKLLGWVVLIGFPMFVWHATAAWSGN